ncbi:T4SS efffector SepA family protein [Hyphobacterium sp.]|uniref:T4SS efffector SepA family protein n=1 Tax=Hyphobacterium sp. TaxID=2004662 RepID=UPI003B52ECE2
MPVIRVSDATFVDLKTVAVWLGTSKPGETIQRLVAEKMDELGMERDIDESSEPVSENSLVRNFVKTPGLSFTRVLAASVGGQALERPNWQKLLLNTIRELKGRGFGVDQIVAELQVPSTTKPRSDQGYKYISDLGISIQGQSAPDAWKEVSRLAEKFSIEVYVKFQWRANPKAQHPGEIGEMKIQRKTPAA